MQGSDVRLNEGGFIDQIAEQLAIGDEGGRISPLLCCDRLELIGLPVDHLDRLSLLVHTLHIAGPAGNHRRGAADVASSGQILSDDGKQNLGMRSELSAQSLATVSRTAALENRSIS